jgi:ATP-dependent exoDNAse (exonuclease V) alpha subunit
METSTLQKHRVRGQQPDAGEKRLYVLDESSLASTRQVHEFFGRLHPNDRVLLVGDRRQHEAVEAGRPFAQLQDAGMRTAKLEEIVRQKDPELKQVVEQLARGEVREAIQNLDRQRRIHEIHDHDKRIAAIARNYAKSPENTLVISPDNRSRAEINGRIHEQLQHSGLVSSEERRIRTLVPRQDLTGADRTWAERYEVEDVLRYSRTSKETGIGKGEYARVKSIDAPSNRLTVARQDGTESTYDPRRQQGVSVFREEMRSFSVGDRSECSGVDGASVFPAIANQPSGSFRAFGVAVLEVESEAEARRSGSHGWVVVAEPSQRII